MEKEDVFYQSLRIEYEYLCQVSFKNFGSHGELIANSINNGQIENVNSYLGYLSLAFTRYQELMDKISVCTEKKQLLALRKEMNSISKDFESIFAKLESVVRDYLYFSISKLNQKNHELNLQFTNFFYRKLKYHRTDLPHLKLFQYDLSPSSSWFKDTLWDYMVKNIDEIENSASFHFYLYNDVLTQYGMDNIDIILPMFEKDLDRFKNDNKKSALSYFLSKYKTHNLKRMSKFEGYIRSSFRNLENELRMQKGLPKIGEGWIEETKLYHFIKGIFPNLKVIHHGQPKFLGRQHYDIWIPKKKVAIEYQGEQHDRPVEFFGGEASFLQQQERDQRKKELSLDNNVTIIYVRKGYSLDTLISEIKNH